MASVISVINKRDMASTEGLQAAWLAFQKTDLYGNLSHHAERNELAEGLLWSAFVAGYMACEQQQQRGEHGLTNDP